MKIPLTHFKNIIICLIFCYSCSPQPDTSTLLDKLQLCRPKGIRETVLCGNYTVYENRQSKSGRTIDLNIIVIPAVHRDSTLPPIFYIDGGPGVAATHSVSFYADTANVYRQYHDVVLIDVRGTGGSGPLHCHSLQYKKGLHEQFAEMYPEEAVKACFDSLSRQADLRQYTTTNIVQDLEEVRIWLGYEKIALFGLSYGGRVVLEYMRLFPLSIESCALWSPASTYNRMPLHHAANAQQSLEQLFNACMLDTACHAAFPHLKDEFIAFMNSGIEKPFIYSYKDSLGHFNQLTIPWFAFQAKIRSMMYSPYGLRQIPLIIHEAYTGNLKPFIELFPEGTDTDDFIAEGLYLCVTCSEDLPFIKESEIGLLTKGTFMGSYRIDQQKQACANWVRGSLPANFLDPVRSDIPTLIISGNLDPVTPSAMAKEIATHLQNSTVVVIPEMSHMPDGLSQEECFNDLFISFFMDPRNPKMNLGCIEEMKPPSFSVR